MHGLRPARGRNDRHLLRDADRRRQPESEHRERRHEGSGYTSVPTVTIGAPAAGGTQATATASLGIVSVTLSTRAGRVTQPVGVVFRRRRLRRDATANVSGIVASVTITNPGTGYTSAP